ncbi:17beta-hydroxysteroid dehydrogenase [Aphelenchoides bicaudatus]|nr:17beta-hydroxysteroid dehydrogenase [Aphelenchoides bicaudatus]
MVCDCTLRAAGYVGLAVVFYKLVIALYHIFYPYLIATPKNLKSLAGAKWAVVTGSTDGIGKAYAFELARKGFDLVLISRTQSKLDDTANEIKQQYQVDIKTIAFDFSNPNLSEYESKVLSELQKLEIGVLVNNVGLSYEYPERLDRLDGGLQRITDITVINTLPVTVLSASILSQMVSRNKGVVVNVSSSAAYHPLFYWAIYSATKKYVNWLSTILRKEYASTGITIQTVCPMMVATKMSKVRKSSLFVPTAQAFVRSAVNSIGLVDETTGCLAHEAQCTVLFGLLPKFIVDKFANQNSLITRSKALKKKAHMQSSIVTLIY